MILIAIGLLFVLRILYSLMEIYFERTWPKRTWRGLAICAVLLWAACSIFSQNIQRHSKPAPTAGSDLPMTDSTPSKDSPK